MGKLGRAAWIWDGSSGFEEAYRLRFRGAFDLEAAPEAAELRVCADARYVAWVNGKPAGRGPVRHWPGFPAFDSIDVTPLLRPGRNVVAVLVSHPGYSTSQYVLGRGGLIACLSADGTVPLETGPSWRASRDAAFFLPAPRVNVSRSHSERFDARLADEAWILPDFDDAAWETARTVGADGEGERGTLEPSGIPPLSRVERRPAAVLAARRVVPRSGGVSLDYKKAFYPDDAGTEDRVQSGLVCCAIRAERACSCRFALRDRKWPAAVERAACGGRELLLPPGTDEVEVPLDAGLSLFSIYLEGAYQRFTLDFVLDLPPGASLEQPLAGSASDPSRSSAFAAVGPFASAAIGNIVCADGFDLGPVLAAAPDPSALRVPADLAGLPAAALPASAVEAPSVKTAFTDRRIVRRLAVPAALAGVLSGSTSPVELPLYPEEGDLELLVDFGDEQSGFFAFELDATEGLAVDAVFFERADGTTAEIPGDLNDTLRYLARGGVQRFLSTSRRGFRYVLLAFRAPAGAGARPRCALRSLSVEESLYPAAYGARFDCPDPLLNRIAALCARTAALCMEDAYVDCPGFEQAFWIGDARNCALVAGSAFGAHALTRRCLLLAARSRARSPVPECHVPAGVSLVLTAWALLWMMACAEYLEETGDLAFAREAAPDLRGTADALLATRGADGLIAPAAWNMFDWAGMDTPYRGKVAHQNATFARALDALAAIERELGETGRAAVRAREASDLRAAFDAAFWDDERSAYRDALRPDGSPSPVFSVQTNLLALLADCVPRARLARVEAFVDSPPPGSVRVGSPFASFFVHERLARQGRLAELLGDVRERWGAMVDLGATTCWETFPGFYQDRLTRSYCHGWSTGPLYFLLRDVLGVRYDRGRALVSIRPACGELSRCSGRSWTPLGPVDVDWSAAGGVLRVRASIPPGLAAEVLAPDGWEGAVDAEIEHLEEGRWA